MRERPRYIASYRDKRSIRKDAFLLRNRLGLDGEFYVPILPILELVLPPIYPKYSFEVVEDRELKGRFAETDLSTGAIRVRESVYSAAEAGNYKARMTLAHELGHFVYHTSDRIQYAQLDTEQPIPINVNPEWQADYFAACFMIPHKLTGHMDEREIASRCGVSFAAARRHIQERTSIKNRHARKRSSATKSKTQLPK